MRSEPQINRGLTPLQRHLLDYRNECSYKTSRTSSYRAPIVSQLPTPTPQILNAPARRKLYSEYGYNFIKDKKNLIAVVIMAGGYGDLAAGNMDGRCKEFCEFDTLQGQGKNLKPVKTTLFWIVFRSLQRAFKENWNMNLYIICNRKNSTEIINFLQQQVDKVYPNASIYLCYQHEGNVLDENGFQNIITSKQTKQKLTYPDGIGTLAQARLIYGQHEQYTLGYHITSITKPRYIYCIGTTNTKEIGYITQHQELDMVFACCAAETRNQELPVVCVRTEKEETGGIRIGRMQEEAWLVAETENVRRLLGNQGEVRRYPVWMDNFVFNTRVLLKQPKASKSLLKYQFNDRILRNEQLQVRCKIPQVTISYAIMGEKSKCVGYMCEDGHFMKRKQDFTNNLKKIVSFSPSKIIKKKGQDSINMRSGI